MFAARLEERQAQPDLRKCRLFSPGQAVGKAENAVHGRGEFFPLLAEGVTLFAAGGRELIVFAAAAFGRFAPAGFQELALFQPMQRRVERPFLRQQRAATFRGNRLSDLIPIGFPPRDHLQDDRLQRSAEQIRLNGHQSFLSRCRNADTWPRQVLYLCRLGMQTNSKQSFVICKTNSGGCGIAGRLVI